VSGQRARQAVAALLVGAAAALSVASVAFAASPSPSPPLPVESVPVLGVVPPVIGILVGVVLIFGAGAYAAARRRRD
jgi:hypothetical protein